MDTHMVGDKVFYKVCASTWDFGTYSIWALLREKLSLGLPTKRVSKQSPQLQRLARKLKFHL